MKNLQPSQLLSITVLDHVKAFTYKQEKLTWLDFKKRLFNYYNYSKNTPTTKHGGNNTKFLKYIVAGEFENNNSRKTDNMISRSMLTLDIDEYEGVIEDLENNIRESFSKFCYVSYSTSNSTKEKPRVRVIIPLAEPVPPCNFAMLVRDYVDGVKNAKLKKALFSDIKNSAAANMMAGLYFKPADKPDWQEFFIENEGEFLPIKDYNIITTRQKETDFLRQVSIKKPLQLTDEEVRELVFFQDAVNCERSTWIKVGMAIYHQYEGLEQGLMLWDEWSKLDKDRYKGLKEITYNYNSFKDCTNPPTMASLLYLKKEKERNLQKPNTQGLPVFYPLGSCIWQHVQGKKLQPIDSSENFKILLENYNFSAHFNVILKSVEVKYNGDLYHQDFDPSVAIIKSLMNINNFKSGCPTMRLSEVAAFNEINPWKDWILSKQWDGISRIEDFYKTVEVESKYEERKRLYLDKWLLQMLNVTCFNDNPIAKIARLVLVFQSKESKQKTYWMKSLAPPSMDKYVSIGKHGNLNQDMDKLDMITCAIAELGELEGVFKKSDMAAIKNFITRSEDTLNIKYQKSHSCYRRRTVYFASVNKTDFLDETGQNTRFAVLPIVQCHFNHGIDMQQLYAEYIETRIKEQYWFDKVEEKILIDSNMQFRNLSPIVEKFNHIFDIEKPIINNKDNYYNLSMLFQELGIKEPKRQDMSIMKSFLSENNYKFNTKKGKYLLPCKKKLQINDFFT